MKRALMNMKTIFALCFAILVAAFNTNAQSTALTSNTNATPALLLNFSGEMQNNAIALTWTMEDETNCKWFVIERSTNGSDYDSIGVVIGLNQNNQTTYNFIDASPLNGNSMYRIRQVDRDGESKYSKVVGFTNNIITPAAARMNIYPNPAVAVVNFTVASAAPDQIFVQVYNLSGVALMTTEQAVSAGNNVQTLAIGSLKSGNYFLKVTNREGSLQYVQSFVKVM